MTMHVPTQPTAAAPAAPTVTTTTPEAPATTTRAARAAAIKAEADQPTSSEPASESSAEGIPSHPASESEGSGDRTSAADSGEDPKARAAAARAERIEAMRARAREAQERRQTHKANRAESAELAELRKMKAEWEKDSAAFKDEESFLSAAEARGVSAEKVIAYFRDRLTNPAAIAERHANQAKTEVEKRIADLEKQLAERDERAAQERAEAAYRQKTLEAAKNFISISQAKAEEAPLTARMYAKHGPEVTIAFANKFIVPLMPEGFDIEVPQHLEVLLDHMEQFLAETQLSEPAQSPPQADPPSKASAGKKNGDKPVSTLGNRVVTERGTVTEEIPLAKLPLSERKRILKEKYERSDD